MAGRGILVLCIVFFVETGNISSIKFMLRILNGQDANIEDFPYQASIRNSNAHICGGTIISNRHILTAGHCVNSMFPPYPWRTVVTGTSSRFSGQHHKISNITVHKNFSTDGNSAVNDVAVITLEDEIIFDKYQQLISLPKHDFTVGQKVILTGWGRTQQSPPSRPTQLQKLEMKIISLKECQKSVSDPSKIDNRNICTNNGKEFGMCLGDSGGPLAANGEIIGIVSWTDGDFCGGGYPDVYTNVYKYKSFIESVMEKSFMYLLKY